MGSNELGLLTRILNIPRGMLARPSIERILYPLVEGRSPTTSPLARIIPNHYQYSPGSTREVHREGFSWTLDLSEWMDWYLYWGLYDPSIERFLAELQPGQTIVDVGANNGRWSLRASEIVGPGGAVHAIEPFPANVHRLLRNLSLNDVANVEHHAVALGDGRGKITMTLGAQDNLGTARVSAAGEQGVEVDQMSLDEWHEQEGIGRVDVIKIDVEGHEEAVISGGRAVLREWRPWLFVELSDLHLAERGSSASNLLALLEGLDYRAVRIDDAQPVTSSDDTRGCHFDIIARP